MSELILAVVVVFILGWVVYKLVRVGLGLRDYFRNTAKKLVKRSHDKERAKQLTDSQAAVPSTPPERMRATIRVNTLTAFTTIS